jgi:hypothetical protein
MNQYEECIFQALMLLVQRDADLMLTQPKEECINHKLAQYLEAVLYKKELLGTCSVDIEYDKYREDEKKACNGRNIRPDIIVHERRSGNRNNLIVIEAKKRYSTKEDKEKVIDLVNSGYYQYSTGVVISYLPQREYLKLNFFTRDDGWKKYLMRKDDFTIRETQR